MQIYTYVLKNDKGFAPNPFHGYCTLACCKPLIRKTAEVGDWVIGTGAVGNVGSNKIIYAMKVTEKLTFNEYFYDKRFANKKPNTKDSMSEKGDNIYCFQDNKWHQLENKNHFEKHISRDTGCDLVLISSEFYYWGERVIELPEYLRIMIKKGPGHKRREDKDLVALFLDWFKHQDKIVSQNVERSKGQCIC